MNKKDREFIIKRIIILNNRLTQSYIKSLDILNEMFESLKKVENMKTGKQREHFNKQINDETERIFKKVKTHQLEDLIKFSEILFANSKMILERRKVEEMEKKHNQLNVIKGMKN